MNTLRQGLGHNLTTAGTGFCSVAWINEYNCTASTVAFWARNALVDAAVVAGPPVRALGSCMSGMFSLRCFTV